ncbi:MAG: four helix bundle protein [Candidatus Paceibacterota bacterium]
MNEFRFLDWDVYKEAKNLVKEIYNITNKFPQNFRYELGSQINRASISIALNISEGSGKSSDPELGRFFNIAIGSAYEVIAGLDIAYDNKLLSKEKFEKSTEKCKNIVRQLGNFKKKLTK